ncbi:MAG: hypothetical protein CBC25_00785 [Pelagibacteraceae bacterium TMED65]|nr:MAG: hypothetical protein CBC25_00785 [Pelagibacteraceae bacterium TMED65]|tara:strand:+ start:767 stop:1963 length:1197 start_codon:yes stop_codon:yes gene_type:complete
MLKICVLGLGYVGLPICLKLSSTFKTVGYDISKNRINSLTKGNDLNNEYKKNQLIKKNLRFSYKIQDLKNCNFFIICVPTPINNSNRPNLSYVEKSFDLISKIIKKDDIIVLESTVYPGVTKKCTKKLENKTNLINNKDISICYSPERINPGDKKKNLNNINKILAYEGQDKKIKTKLINVYKKISKKIIFTKNINEAETAKGIENIQRDLNIALFNEILIICNKLKLNFNEVIRLASTKWNFLKFNPGLVGGHCLPVDPYYLTHVANKKGYKSKVTLSGRQINNFMKKYVIDFTNSTIAKSQITKKKVKLCIVGLTYKYGVADTRNSQKLEIYRYFKSLFNFTKGFDPFLKSKDKLNDKEIKEYDFFLFLSKGEKFKKLTKKIENKKIIDPFSYYSN